MAIQTKAAAAEMIAKAVLNRVQENLKNGVSKTVKLTLSPKELGELTNDKFLLMFDDLSGKGPVSVSSLNDFEGALAAVAKPLRQKGFTVEFPYNPTVAMVVSFSAVEFASLKAITAFSTH